jgi:transcriptional regulator with GAF, ATPase, and Fis domain
VEVQEADDAESLECIPGHSLALVALGRDSVPDANSFDLIKALRAKGFRIVSYEDEVFSWPIGTRCRALLNGSFLLLDSRSRGFAEELQTTLTKHWLSESEGQVEEQRITDQMESLGIAGRSSQMLTIFRSALRFSALSDFPVLISGETGTGKELVAKALYRLDNKRNNGPFVVANCGAINSGVAESELFGHRRGAFTGADTDRKGLFRSADGGVLFLDEIGELDLGLQAKLLRVLQEERVLGVGFDREQPIDVRVVAATNKDLEAMVREGTFREDLYHRLNVLSIQIPPLRERREDLQPLIEHFIAKYATLGQSLPRAVSSEFLEALGEMKLSGNARQLENIVRRAMLNASGKSSLSLSELTAAEWRLLAGDGQLPEIAAELATQPVESRTSFDNILHLHGWNLSRSLDYCERALLECALTFTNGNQSQTARLIGITPRSVYNKLQKHKLRFSGGDC